MTRPRFMFPVLSLLVLGIATSACSSSVAQTAAPPASAPGGATSTSQPASIGSGSAAPDAKVAATAPDACSLITDAEAGTLFGGAVTHKAGGSSDASNGSGVTVTKTLCEWDLVTSDQLGHDLWVAVYGGADRAYFDDAVTHETPIPGLGDAAAGHPFSGGAGGFSEVKAISHGTVIGIYGSLPGTSGIQQAAAFAVAKL